MQTISELHSFRRAADAAGLRNEEISALITYLAAHPEAGDEIEGTGGCRKLRWALKANNKGKSSGARVVTFYSGPNIPLFLITVFAKNTKVNLTKQERNHLKTLTTAITDTFARRLVTAEPKERS